MISKNTIVILSLLMATLACGLAVDGGLAVRPNTKPAPAASTQTLAPPGLPVVGAAMPDFRATSIEQKLVRISDLRGKVALIDFWATWCGPCRDEIPNLVATYKAYQEKGFVIVGISFDGKTGEPPPLDAVKKFIKENGMAWTHVVEGKGWESVVGQQFGITAIPASILIDRRGKVIATNLGGQELANAVAKATGSKEITLPHASVAVAPPPVDPLMPPNITSERRTTLTHGIHLLAGGDTEFARGHFEGAVSVNRCKVLFVLTAVPEEQREAVHRAALDGMNLWNEAFPNRVHFEEGTKPEDSPVQVFFVPTTVDSGKYVAGVTKSDAPHDGKRVPHRATVLVATYKSGSRAFVSMQTIQHVVAHELGHVLGVGELPEPRQIMGPNSENPSVKLSPEDLSLVRSLLEYQETLFQRLEKREQELKGK